MIQIIHPVILVCGTPHWSLHTGAATGEGEIRAPPLKKNKATNVPSFLNVSNLLLNVPNFMLNVPYLMSNVPNL